MYPRDASARASHAIIWAEPPVPCDSTIRGNRPSTGCALSVHSPRRNNGDPGGPILCSEFNVAGLAGYQTVVRSAWVAAPRQLYAPGGTNLLVAAPTGHSRPSRLWLEVSGAANVSVATNSAVKPRPTTSSYASRLAPFTVAPEESFYTGQRSELTWPTANASYPCLIGLFSFSFEFDLSE
jgi:hypothetical protein